METSKRPHGGPACAPIPSCRCRAPALGALMLLLGLGAAAPARATSGTIDGPVVGPIVVGVGETLNIVNGAAVTVPDFETAVVVEGGTLNISGGTISGADGWGVLVSSGTVNMSGGSISEVGPSGQNSAGVAVQGGAVSISGGSISAGGCAGSTCSGHYALEVYCGGTVSISGGSISGVFAVQGAYIGGTINISGGSFSGWVLAHQGAWTISGCNLVLSNPTPQTVDFGVFGILSGTLYSLTGTLQDGTAIDAALYINSTLDGAVVSPQIVFDDHCSPSDIAHLVTQFVTDTAVAQGLTDKLNAIATAMAQGNAQAKAGAVGAFINQVRAQTGKSISAEQAATLIRLVMAL